MEFYKPCRRDLRILIRVASCVICPLLAYSIAIDPRWFDTSAKFSVDRTALSLSTVVATIEARPNVPGYSWVRINFYSFPPAAEDITNILIGNTQSMDRKWSRKANNPSDYNTSNAIIQLSVDSSFKVWQVDMAVPGHSCTIAPFEPDVRQFLQSYEFDGKKLKLKSMGSYVCDMKFMGIANQTYRWDIDLNIPVFEKRNLKP